MDNEPVLIAKLILMGIQKQDSGLHDLSGNLCIWPKGKIDLIQVAKVIMTKIDSLAAYRQNYLRGKAYYAASQIKATE